MCSCFNSHNMYVRKVLTWCVWLYCSGDLVAAVRGQLQASQIKADPHGNLLQSFRNMDVTTGPAGTPRSTANTGTNSILMLVLCFAVLVSLCMFHCCSQTASCLACVDEQSLGVAMTCSTVLQGMAVPF